MWRARTEHALCLTFFKLLCKVLKFQALEGAWTCPQACVQAFASAYVWDQPNVYTETQANANVQSEDCTIGTRLRPRLRPSSTLSIRGLAKGFARPILWPRLRIKSGIYPRHRSMIVVGSRCESPASLEYFNRFIPTRNRTSVQVLQTEQRALCYSTPTLIFEILTIYFCLPYLTSQPSFSP